MLTDTGVLSSMQNNFSDEYDFCNICPVHHVPNYGPCRNTCVYGLEDAIRYAKYPMSVDPDNLTSELTKGIRALAQSGKGEAHDQWLTGVTVQFDLEFTVKAWTEMERYTFVNFISLI